MEAIAPNAECHREEGERRPREDCERDDNKKAQLGKVKGSRCSMDCRPLDWYNQRMHNEQASVQLL